jgi:hypothetical protein
MVHLYGKTWSKQDLLQHVGDIGQIGRVQLKSLEDGAERGVRVADVSTGSGLNFTVLIDRGMDIGPADWAGQPLAWRSGAGAVHPAYYDPAGLGWLRSFPGGLMVGCGLDNVGQPEPDQGQDLGLHGRLSNTPARLLSYGGRWKDDDYVLWVEGQVTHYQLFTAHLVLTRRISSSLGSNTIHLEDTIVNAGFKTAPFQILYHCNFGFPVVSPSTELLIDTFSSTPRDEQATRDLDHHRRFQSPTPGYLEQVFYHLPRPDPEGYAQAALINRDLDFGAYLRFRLAELPHLVQWKMMGEGAYVVGLEPANCWVEGRAKDREQGVLRFLQPGESVSTHLEIGVLPNSVAIASFAAKMGLTET